MMRVRVNGIPAPQGSKRHVGNGRMVEMSKAVGPWRDAVRGELQRAGERFGDQAVTAALTFYLSRPRGHYRASGDLKPGAPLYPGVRPDLDKLVRSTLDGITMSGAIGDDCLVVAIAAAKFYAHDRQPPGCVIDLEPAS